MFNELDWVFSKFWVLCGQTWFWLNLLITIDPPAALCITVLVFVSEGILFMFNNNTYSFWCCIAYSIKEIIISVTLKSVRVIYDSNVWTYVKIYKKLDYMKFFSFTDKPKDAYDQ